MAYSDYGGYAYRNGKRVVERSDATITPDGDTYGTPGSYPGFALLSAGVDHAEVMKRVEWPSGHAVLGDGPIYVVLYKQSWTRVFRGAEEIDVLTALDNMPPESVREWSYGGKSGRSLNTDYFRDTGTPLRLRVDGWSVEARYTDEDNYYQYVKLTQPDGNVWHGWSGYGVGAGLEDCGYGFSTSDREEALVEFWPEAIHN